MFFATDQWECRQAASRTTRLRQHLCGIGTMALTLRGSTGAVEDDTWEPGQQSTITTTSGCKLTLEEQRRSLRCPYRDVRILTSGLRSIISRGVSTGSILCITRNGIILRCEASLRLKELSYSMKNLALNFASFKFCLNFVLGFEHKR